MPGTRRFQTYSFVPTGSLPAAAAAVAAAAPHARALCTLHPARALTCRTYITVTPVLAVIHTSTHITWLPTAPGRACVRLHACSTCGLTLPQGPPAAPGPLIFSLALAHCLLGTRAPVPEAPVRVELLLPAAAAALSALAPLHTRARTLGPLHALPWAL